MGRDRIRRGKSLPLTKEFCTATADLELKRGGLEARQLRRRRKTPSHQKLLQLFFGLTIARPREKIGGIGGGTRVRAVSTVLDPVAYLLKRKCSGSDRRKREPTSTAVQPGVHKPARSPGVGLFSRVVDETRQTPRGEKGRRILACER